MSGRLPKKQEKRGMAGIIIVMLCAAFLSGCGRGQENREAAPRGEQTPDFRSEEQPPDFRSGEAESKAAEQPAESSEKEPEGYDIVLTFAGDICLDDTCAVMQDYVKQGEQLENNIDSGLLVKMREADLRVVNNEFAYSDRGEPLANKMYTFRADPKRVSMLQAPIS